MKSLLPLVAVCLVVPACIGTAAASSRDVYQVLRGDRPGFAEVRRGDVPVFPRDHGMHPDHRIEWWYLTANLQDGQGRDWGLQWTLFRQALRSDGADDGWSSRQMWMAHAALTLPDDHRHEERFARGGIGQSGVRHEPRFEAWLDDWHWQGSADGPVPGRLEFTVGGQRVALVLEAGATVVLQGEQGYSRKSQKGQASHYYSQPDIRVSARVDNAAGESVRLDGLAWLDHEWSSQPLAADQQGWDWLALHLDDGAKLMLYRLRHDDGEHYLSGSVLGAQGQVRILGPADVRLRPTATSRLPLAGGRHVALPLHWRIDVVDGVQGLSVRPILEDQWMATRFPYWEGAVKVLDVRGNRTGRGYMELTGYPQH